MRKDLQSDKSDKCHVFTRPAAKGTIYVYTIVYYNADYLI